MLLIGDCLSLVDVICIFLCDRRLYATFRHRNHSMLLSGRDKIPLLDRLEQDVPTYFTCYICHLPHKSDASQVLGPHAFLEKKNPDSLPCFSEWTRHPSLAFKLRVPWCMFEYPIYFTHFQLVMKGFYHGPQFGLSTEAICHTRVQCHPIESVNLTKSDLFRLTHRFVASPSVLFYGFKE